MMPHTATQFEAELFTLGERLVAMAARAAEQIATAMRALAERNDDLAQAVISRDADIDRAEIEIDELAMRLLATRQPVASDLRFVTMALKSIVDIERIGDLAVGVAKRALELNRLPPLDYRVDLTDLTAQVQKNLSLALEAFVRRDAELAAHVIKADAQIDRINAALFAGLLAHLASDPATVTRVLPLTSVCRYLERIGDHVKNLAEEVIFLVRGVNVRHKSLESQN